MKRTMKRTLSVLLAVLFLLSAFSAGSGTLAVDGGYQKGDVIEFGSYPQSRVTDEETLAALNAMDKDWQSYGYTSFYEPSDFMRYADLELDGVRYRAVTFDAFRPRRVDWGASYYVQNYQQPNGYERFEIYYFRYDPIRWIVLNEETGLVFAERVLDAHEYFSHEIVQNPEDEVWYQDETYTHFASYWPTSDLCHWLNSTFYETAFSGEEAQMIQLYTKQDVYRGMPLRHDLTGPGWTGTVSWSEKVFLPTAKELSPRYSGELADSAAEYLLPDNGTEYAFCQGTQKLDSEKGDVAYLYTRTQGRDEYACTMRMEDERSIAGLLDVFGVRPEMHVDLARLAAADNKPVSGTCGENVQWAFDEESGVLSLTGTGAMDSLDAFEDYGYSVWKDDIQFVAAADGVTSIGAHAFEGCPVLEEVILGEDVTTIGEAAFTDCPRLMNVTLLSEKISADGAFPKDRTDWMLIFSANNLQAIALAKQLGAAWIPVSFKDNILSFGGTITVHDDYVYSYLPMFIQRYGSAQKVYFNRLVFADVPADSVTKQAYTGEYFGCLVMYYVEVTLLYISPDGEQEVTYDQMIELLQSGDYRAFKLRITSTTEDGDERTQEEIIEQKIAELFPNMPKKVVRLVSKAINFIVRLFKR